MKRGAVDGPFLAAARGLPSPRRPVWIMRQAGRYLPEYRAIREKMSFLLMCKTPEAAAEVTLQPIRRYDMDAAILFTDLLVPVEPMGIGLRYEPAPVLERTIGSMSDVESLRVPEPEADLTPMLDSARRVRAELAEDKALIGFVGAPFTMACYLVEGRGSKNWDQTRRLMHGDPAVFDALLGRITECLRPLVTALVQAGCDAIQVFDSWASVVSTDDYVERCAPHTDRLLSAARDTGAVAIHYVNGAAQHIDRMASAPADVLGVDWRLPMREVRARAGGRTVQGNLDPTALFASEATLRNRVAAVCRDAGPDRHIFNLGHGILPPTDPQALAIVIDEVRKS